MRNTTEPRHGHYRTNNEVKLARGPSHIPAQDYHDQEPVPLVQRGLRVSVELTQDHTRFSEDLCLPPLESIKLILQNEGQRRYSWARNPGFHLIQHEKHSNYRRPQVPQSDAPVPATSTTSPESTFHHG